MNNAGKPRGQPGVNRPVKRAKRLDPWLAMERLVENHRFRRFFMVLVNQIFEDRVITAEGLRDACLGEGLRISTGTAYNYLYKLETLKVVQRKYDGRKNWFGFHSNADRYNDLAYILNRDLEQQ